MRNSRLKGGDNSEDRMISKNVNLLCIMYYAIHYFYSALSLEMMISTLNLRHQSSTDLRQMQQAKI
jgi:hypothetical protein